MSAALTVIEAAQNLPASLGPDLAVAVELAKAEKAASTQGLRDRLSDLPKLVRSSRRVCSTGGP
jgi:hypothetical protein